MNPQGHKANGGAGEPQGVKLTPVPKLAELIADPGKVSALPLEAIPAMRGELARLDTMLLCRLMNASRNGHVETPAEDNWLKAEQAAPLLGVTPRWLYRHAKRLPFARRLSRKALRFSERGLRKWQSTKNSLTML